MSEQPHEKSSSVNNSGASPLEALHFLLGQWQAISQPGEAAGGFSFVSQLQSKVIIRTNYADYPAAAERPAFRHDDLMVIYLDEAKSLCADYYDSEGHVIRYSGQAAEANKVFFTSEPTAAGPGFRLSYHLTENGELNGAFEIAIPNQPGKFAPYLTWSARRGSSLVTWFR